LQELPASGEKKHILLSKKFKSLSVDDLQKKYSLVGGMSNHSAKSKASKL
jgi:hypothetical protein